MNNSIVQVFKLKLLVRDNSEWNDVNWRVFCWYEAREKVMYGVPFDHHDLV